MRFTVTVYVNVKEDMMFFLDGYGPTDPIAQVDTQFVFDRDGLAEPTDIADAMWPVGNKVRADDDGQNYPPDVRSLSVGDMLKIEGGGLMTFITVDSIGWSEVIEPTNPIVSLKGTNATSRQ